ncbi:MAG TPA: hypothetical protein VKE51_13220 [Vicinamibacterales bacterium]|nr:hypothetical protein [Vicinamibacterales bacterium]
MTPAENRATFWLATLPLSKNADSCQVLALADPPEAVDARTIPKNGLAVEVWRWDDNRHFALLISTADNQRAPTQLTCVFGVTNDPQWCDSVASKGFPVIEGAFEFDRDRLVVRTDIYPLRHSGQPSSPKRAALVRIRGLVWETAPGEDADIDPVYDQLRTTPDLGEPNSILLGQRVRCDPGRSPVRRVDTAGARLEFEAVLYPDLTLLPEGHRPASAWTGAVTNPQLGASEKPYPPPTQYPPALSRRRDLQRFKRESVFGAPAFVFEDLDIAGFRIDIDSGDQAKGRTFLAGLIQDLNFHLGDTVGGVLAVPDFRYEPATSTIVVELLRYGKMKSRSPLKPLAPDDFMSQHELIVRVLVGRVDDDTAQARDAAVFVPAIFVDNPWSKAVGRHLQGFPKMLADFCADGQPLQMDGRGADGNVVSLTRVSEIRLVDWIGGAAPADTPILSLQCPDTAAEADQFERVDLGSLFAMESFSGVPWRQGDFMDRAEFRRSFARSVIENRFNGFRSVQVSPVDDIGLPKTWISGRFSLDHVTVAFPVGVATLTFGTPRRCPPAWKTLCRTLRAAYGDTIGFPTGSWYRVRCSMNLDVVDALSW